MDRERIRQFMERFEGIAAGAAAVGALAVADRAGVLAKMATREAVTASDLAGDDYELRYVEEILNTLAAAGIIEYQPENGSFSLPPEHAAVLVDETSPYLLAGWLDGIPGAMKLIDRIAHVTRIGGGIPVSEYEERLVAGIDRLNSPGIRVLLARRWLQAMPDVVAKLAAGARVADVGCGSGAAAITIAAAYPSSTVIGYDIDRRALDRARASSGSLANLAFELRPAGDLPVKPGFDLITTFDVIHDLSHPLPALQRIQEALTPDGTYLMVEPAAGPRLEDNLSPRGTLLYGFGLLYCLPQSLVGGGAGLGVGWGPVKAAALCREAGFSQFEHLPVENPYSNFFRIER
ncbi:MAG: class I SAM-dependent methyltransferase [Actinomycetota bacterium]